MAMGDLAATVWKDKQNVNMLTNIHHTPAESTFCDEHGNTIKPEIKSKQTHGVCRQI
jgi:hypothetical protein